MSAVMNLVIGDMLAQMTSGFRDATHGAQQSFRTLLDAMSHPGRVFDLPPVAIDGIVPPPSATPGRQMGIGTAAILLSLLDADTGLHLAGSLASAAAHAYLRFHTGVLPARPDGSAAFTVARADEVDAALWTRIEMGSDEAPQAGATLIVEVDALGPDADTQLELVGPGIEATQTLRVSGLSSEFWRWRGGLQALLPRGFDLVLVCGARVSAVPRTTRIVKGT